MVLQGMPYCACTGCSSSHASSAGTTCKADLLSGGTYGHPSLSAALWVLPVWGCFYRLSIAVNTQGDP